MKIAEYDSDSRQWTYSTLQTLPRFFSRTRDLHNRYGNAVVDCGRVRVNGRSAMVFHFEDRSIKVVEMTRAS
jgi:hypothetical protein